LSRKAVLSEPLRPWKVRVWSRPVSPVSWTVLKLKLVPPAVAKF
jgi:hypothetical protein